MPVISAQIYSQLGAGMTPINALHLQVLVSSGGYRKQGFGWINELRGACTLKATLK